MKKLFLLFALLLLPAYAGAATRYISPTGSNSNSCAASTSSSTPKQTFEGASGAVACMAGSDTVVMLGGTFTKFLDRDVTGSIPSGAPGAPTIFTVQPGATVTALSNSGFGPVEFNNGANISYVTIDGGVNCGANSGGAACNLIIDGTGIDSVAASTAINIGTGNHHFTITNFEITNNPAANGTSGPGTSGVMSNCNIHDSGTVWQGPTYDPSHAGGYAMYIGNGTDITVENCRLHHNGGFGLHVNPNVDIPGIIFRYNDIYANGQISNIECAGILISYGPDAQVYSNSVHDNIGNCGGILTYFFKPAVRTKIYNNTVTRNARFGINLDSSVDSVVRNNIIVDNNTGNTGRANIENNTGTGAVLSNNLCFGAGGTLNCSGGTNVNADPQFVGAGGGGTDFRLLTTSPAKDAGATLGAPYNVDLMGTTRPQGTAYDLGAYELATPPSCPTNPRSLVASYSFNDVATDSTGNTGPATLGTGVTYSGNALTFTGAAGATVADTNVLDLCDGLSLMAQVNVPDTTTDRMFVVKNPNSKYFLGMLKDYCSVGAALVGGYSQGGNLVIACDPTLLTTGVLTHVAVTYDAISGVVTLYKNGAVRATAMGGAVLDATTGTLQFCSSGFSENCPNTSILDEVKVYTYARSPAEIITDTGSMSRTVKIGAGQTVKLGTQ